MMQITKMEAIRSLDGELAFHIDPDGVVSLATVDGKISGVLPTDIEIQAEMVRLQAEYDAQEYSRNRKTEYPSIPEQLDYIYHNGVEKWKTDMILPVKEKYPKGDS